MHLGEKPANPATVVPILAKKKWHQVTRVSLRRDTNTEATWGRTGDEMHAVWCLVSFFLHFSQGELSMLCLLLIFALES